MNTETKTEQKTLTLDEHRAALAKLLDERTQDAERINGEIKTLKKMLKAIDESDINLSDKKKPPLPKDRVLREGQEPQPPSK